MSTDEYAVWETVWSVWKMRDGELVSTGKHFATEAEAVAVADALSHTETRVVSFPVRVGSPPSIEYAPDEQDLEVAWIESEASADDINAASAEFDRFLARVRRDAVANCPNCRGEQVE